MLEIMSNDQYLAILGLIHFSDYAEPNISDKIVKIKGIRIHLGLLSKVTCFWGEGVNPTQENS